MTTARLGPALAVHLTFVRESDGGLSTFCGAGRKDGGRKHELLPAQERATCLRCAEMAHRSYPLAYVAASANAADDLIDDDPRLHRFYGCDELRYRGRDGRRRSVDDPGH
jgi:hypothetical protein